MPTPILATTLATALALLSPTDSDSNSDTPLLERVAVVGASASAGFSIERFGSDWTLARILSAASTQPLSDVLDVADPMFFLSPPSERAATVDAAYKHSPSLLIALDFPFWYAYGNAPSVKHRAELLDGCLALLDRFDCPILIADLPDMHHALEAEQPMLSESQIPSVPDLKQLNTRLAKWASSRDHVVLVPLASFVTDLRSRRPLSACGNRWEGDDLEDLMQADDLHPTREGMVALGLLVIEQLQSKHPSLRGKFLTDRFEIAKRAESVALTR